MTRLPGNAHDIVDETSPTCRTIDSKLSYALTATICVGVGRRYTAGWNIVTAASSRCFGCHQRRSSVGADADADVGMGASDADGENEGTDS